MLIWVTVVPRPGVLDHKALITNMKLKCSASPLTPVVLPSCLFRQFRTTVRLGEFLISLAFCFLKPVSHSYLESLTGWTLADVWNWVPGQVPLRCFVVHTPLASDVSYSLTFISTLYFKNIPSGKILFIFSFTLLDKTYVTFVIGSQKNSFWSQNRYFWFLSKSLVLFKYYLYNLLGVMLSRSP